MAKVVCITGGSSPEEIAGLIIFIATRPDYVNTSDIAVTPTAQANALYI